MVEVLLVVVVVVVLQMYSMFVILLLVTSHGLLTVIKSSARVLLHTSEQTNELHTLVLLPLLVMMLHCTPVEYSTESDLRTHTPAVFSFPVLAASEAGAVQQFSLCSALQGPSYLLLWIK